MAPPRNPPASSLNYPWLPLDPNPPSEAPRPDAAASSTILSTPDLVSALGGIWRAVAPESPAAGASPYPSPAGFPWRSSVFDFEEVQAMKRSLLFAPSSSASCSRLGYGYFRNRHERKRLDCVGSESNNLVGASVPPGVPELEREATGERSVLGRYSGQHEDYHIDYLVSYDNAIREFQGMGLSRCVDASSAGAESVAQSVDAVATGNECDYGLPIKDRVHAVFARKKHALAGAMAGTFVSVCLHPVDTVKTVVQTHSANKVSVYSTLRSIVSERGILGLYRGIASSIASSAPISGVYTFTYETVKGALLPILPKEYHSFAHCTAGGCASVATSFIFTPSERIKQQMQVRSNYHNCWNALVGVLEKGGLQSLYAGWSAVLCRNVPHSIIKFYTYESLKQLLLSSSGSDASLNTLQTLLCGGIAGSTAALFSTPFDVIKTKLQTQVPGSPIQYWGVFHLLKQIARMEGLCGLYRGLSPRLVMYVSQGAIFFASYEFFKAIFSLDVLPVEQEDDSID